MNTSELSGAAAGSSNNSMGWAALRQEVPFAMDDSASTEAPNATSIVEASRPTNNLTEVERSTLRERLKRLFYRQPAKIMQNLFYDGAPDEPGDYSDPEAYTPILALQEADNPLLLDDQTEMFKEFAKTQSLSSERREALAGKLAEIVVNSEFAGEIFSGDGFLRRRRVGYLAGRWESSTFGDLVAARAIWSVDPNFYDSKEAKSLITDHEYLHHVYGKAVEDYITGGRRSTQESQTIDKETLEDAEQLVGEKLRHSIEEGHLTVMELLADPFLRKRRPVFNTNGQPEAVKLLWKLDGAGFYNSIRVREYLKEVRANNPDIFDGINRAEMEQRVNEALKSIPDEGLENTLLTYRRDPYAGDRQFIRILSQSLGLAETVSIDYGGASSADAAADYNSVTNTIRFYSDNKCCRLENLPARMGTVGHEMWHAIQYKGKNIPPDVRQQYLRNDRYYFDPKWAGNDLYRGQLLELEAYMFESGITHKVEELLEKERSNGE